MSFKPVYNNNGAAINTDIEANIVREWIKANWAVPDIPVGKVDFAFLNDQMQWEGKSWVLNFYSDPPRKADFEVSPNSKEYRTRVIIDVWVNDEPSYTNGIISPALIKIHKWLEQFIDLNPTGLRSQGIGQVDSESYNFIPFTSNDDIFWFHYNHFVLLHYLLVKQ